jgi:TonB family protein
MKLASRLICAAVTALFLQAGVCSAQDTLAAAKQLYASAAYDEALAMFDRLKSGGADDTALTSLVEEHRAFCLLAVGRQADAERAMESLIARDPTFRPDDDISPRLLSVFRDVRKRMLPVVIRQRYVSAKASFDEKAYRAAADQFDVVLGLLEAPEVVASDPALADLRTVARGFRDLAKAAADPPAPPAASPAPNEPTATGPAVAPSSSPSVSAALSTPAPRPPRAFYTADDPGVTAPVAIKQVLPPWPRGIPKPTQRGQGAVLDIVISESGAVESVVVRQSLAAWYDAALVHEAKSWSYKPATRDGAPVRYRKVMQVVVDK